jgi:hypothetical protein
VRVDAKRFTRTFPKKGLAESFRSELIVATRKGEDFSAETGLPASMDRARMDVTVARSITNPDRQAQTLATVAEALAARGETRQGRHVASVVCAVGRWTMALVPVLSLEPPAIRVPTDPYWRQPQDRLSCLVVRSQAADVKLPNMVGGEKLGCADCSGTALGDASHDAFS